MTDMPQALGLNDQTQCFGLPYDARSPFRYMILVKEYVMKKQSVKRISLLTGSILFAAAFHMNAFAEESTETAPANTHGAASYYGQSIDESVLSDSAAMLSLGFDETDLAYLNDGKNVTYAVRYSLDNPGTYQDLEADSAEKRKIDAYFAGKTVEPEDSLLTSYYAERKRGDEPTEVLEGVTGVSGKVGLGLTEEQGDVYEFVQNGTFTMLYLAGENAVLTESTATPNENGYVVIDFKYLGSGDYIVLYDAAESAETTAPASTETTTETTAETTSASAEETTVETSASETTAAEQQTTTAKPAAQAPATVGKMTVAAPDTGDSGVVSAAALGILFTALGIGIRKKS